MPLDEDLPPARWHDFINEITRLFYVIRESPSIEAAVRMNRRSMRKMSMVTKTNVLGADAPVKEPYIQNGFVQRGLGFGWRMNQLGIPLDELRQFFWLMPVSIGVVFLTAKANTIMQRNHDRKLVPETAHEDRAYQVLLMAPAITLAKEVLTDRGVDIVTISTEQPIEDARAELVAFANHKPHYTETPRPGSEVAAVSAPVWFD